MSGLCIRILYVRILHIHICQYVHICTYRHACVSLLFSPISFSIWSISGQIKDIFRIKKCQISTWNLHIVKNVNLSFIVLGFRLLCEFTDKLPLIKIVFMYWILHVVHVMLTVQSTAVNESPWQRIILLVVFTGFEWNNRLWLCIDCKLILRIINRETTSSRRVSCFAGMGKSLVGQQERPSNSQDWWNDRSG